MKFEKQKQEGLLNKKIKARFYRAFLFKNKKALDKKNKKDYNKLYSDFGGFLMKRFWINATHKNGEKFLCVVNRPSLEEAINYFLRVHPDSTIVSVRG